MVKYTVIKNMVYIYNSLHNHLHKQRQLQRTEVESRADTKPGLGVTCVCGGASISWHSFLLFASVAMLVGHWGNPPLRWQWPG